MKIEERDGQRSEVRTCRNVESGTSQVGSSLTRCFRLSRSSRIARCGAFALALFLVALRCTVAFGSLSQPTESPTEVVRATLTEVFRILEDPKLKDPAKLITRRRMLEDVIADRFDYAEMSKRALAANWTPLTNDQRVEFVELFKAFL